MPQELGLYMSCCRRCLLRLGIRRLLPPFLLCVLRPAAIMGLSAKAPTWPATILPSFAD
jgi:hypothetical protein